jgi:hypothetical protein
MTLGVIYSSSRNAANLVAVNYFAINHGQKNSAHDLSMRSLLFKLASIFASLIATKHGERMYADL